MTRDPAHADGAPDGPLAAARRTLAVERQRTVDERDALSAFSDRVREIDVVGTSPATGPGLAIQTRDTSDCSAVRDAYEETVMSLPHYEDEYGDDYVDSVEVEFGPDVAAALTQGSFGQYCKQSVITKAEQAREERERLLTALDSERESLVDTETRIHGILDRVTGTIDDAYDDLSFGTLVDIRSTLLDLRAECDELAADRQAAIRRQHRKLWVPRSAPDVPVYVYQQQDTTYPVLSVIADLGEQITEHRRIVERTMAWSS